MLILRIDTAAALRAVYMPFMRHGAIFLRGDYSHGPGDEVFLLLRLPQTDEALPVTARVVWITATGSQGNRPQGVGLQFCQPDMQAQIEKLLAEEPTDNDKGYVL